jgi:hypothetical protein
VAFYPAPVIVEQITEVLNIQKQLQFLVAPETDFLAQPQADYIRKIRFAGVAFDDRATFSFQAVIAIDETVEVRKKSGVAGDDRVRGAGWYVKQVRTGVVAFAAEISEECAAECRVYAAEGIRVMPS